MSYKWTLLLSIWTLAVSAAEMTPLRVRTGVITRAVFTSTKPDFEGKSPLRSNSSKAWAVLTLQLDPGRASSIYDFALRQKGKEFSCLDIAPENASFSGKMRCDRIQESGKKFKLVFAISSEKDPCELIFKLDRRENPVKLNLPPPPKPAPKAAAKSKDAPAGKQEAKEKTAVKK